VECLAEWLSPIAWRAWCTDVTPSPGSGNCVGEIGVSVGEVVL
jgi:hypothetical protein